VLPRVLLERRVISDACFTASDAKAPVIDSLICCIRHLSNVRTSDVTAFQEFDKSMFVVQVHHTVAYVQGRQCKAVENV